MYKLYYFHPETINQTGYEFVVSLETEQDCNTMAFHDGKIFFRIEKENSTGASLIFETPQDYIAPYPPNSNPVNLQPLAVLPPVEEKLTEIEQPPKSFWNSIKKFFN